MRTAETDFVLMAMFHPNLPREMVFSRVSLTPFPFNFVTEIVMEVALFPCENGSIDTCSDRKPSDLECG